MQKSTERERKSMSFNNSQARTRGKDISNQVTNCVNGARIVKLKHEGILLLLLIIIIMIKIIIHNIYHGRNNITCSTNCK